MLVDEARGVVHLIVDHDVQVLLCVVLRNIRVGEGLVGHFFMSRARHSGDFFLVGWRALRFAGSRERRCCLCVCGFLGQEEAEWDVVRKFKAAGRTSGAERIKKSEVWACNGEGGI